MAIYHLSMKPISRSAGRSATAAAAYRAGCEVVDERTGEIHNYTRKGGVLSARLILPGGGTAERAAFWSRVEVHHKHPKATTAREIVLALPRELSDEQRRELAEQYGRDLADRWGVAVDVCIHAPDASEGEENPHAHILMTACSCTPQGGLGKKVEALDPIAVKMKKTDRVTAAEVERPLWEALANAALEHAGRAERIDHRTLEAQGIARAPTTHDGPARTAIKRRLRAASDAVESIQAELASAVRGAAQAAALAAAVTVPALAAAVEPPAAPQEARQAVAAPVAPQEARQAPQEARQAVAAPVAPQEARQAPQEARQAVAAPVAPQEARQAPQEARQAPQEAEAAPVAPAVPDAGALRRQAAELRKAALQADAQRNAASMLAAQLGDPRGYLVTLRRSLSDAQRERETIERQIQARSWIERLQARLGDSDAERVAELRRKAQDIGRQIAETTALVPAADQAAEVARAEARAAKAAQAAVMAAEASLQAALAAQAQADRIARQDAQRQDEPDDPDPHASRQRG